MNRVYWIPVPGLRAAGLAWQYRLATTPLLGEILPRKWGLEVKVNLVMPF